jgi:hypothetical protein
VLKDTHHGGPEYLFKIYIKEEVGVFGEILFVKTKDNTEKKNLFFFVETTNRPY